MSTATDVDIHYQKKRLESAFEKGFSGFGKDQDIVESFLIELKVEGLSAARINKYISILSALKKLFQDDFRHATENDIKKLVLKIESCEKSGWTKTDYKVGLKRFLRHLGKEPKWLKSSNGNSSKVLPEEILSEDEIKKMGNASYTDRDRAFVLSLYESGCRIGEFLPLRFKHLNFDKHGVVIRVTGKTGSRRIRLVFSTLSLQRWIANHPQRDNKDAFLWCKIPAPYNGRFENKPISYSFVSKILRELAERGGIKKRVNPHAFRHARATFMARHLKEPEMREFFGWGRDSEMPSIYVHLSGRDVDNSVLSIYGIKEGKKSQEPILKIFECPRCKDRISGNRQDQYCYCP
jgi:integrase